MSGFIHISEVAPLVQSKLGEGSYTSDDAGLLGVWRAVLRIWADPYYWENWYELAKATDNLNELAFIIPLAGRTWQRPNLQQLLLLRKVHPLVRGPMARGLWQWAIHPISNEEPEEFFEDDDYEGPHEPWNYGCEGPDGRAPRYLSCDDARCAKCVFWKLGFFGCTSEGVP